MGWLTTWSEANKIVDSIAKRNESMTIFSPPSTHTTYTRIVDENQYRYVGMTLDTANYCAEAMLDSGKSAFIQREAAGGAYSVTVGDQTYSLWKVKQ